MNRNSPIKLEFGVVSVTDYDHSACAVCSQVHSFRGEPFVLFCICEFNTTLSFLCLCLCLCFSQLFIDFAELIRPDSNVPTVCNAVLVEKAGTATRLTVSISTKRRHGGKTATLLRAASRKK